MAPPHSLSVSTEPSNSNMVVPKNPPAKFRNVMSWSASSVVLLPPPSSISCSDELFTEELSVRNPNALRELDGSSTSCFWSRLAETLELSVFSSDASAVTVTDSDSDPTANATSCVAVSPALSTIPDCLYSLKPPALMVRIYADGGRSLKRYRPVASVAKVRLTPVSVLDSVTVALGTMAPVGSATTPESVAVVVASCSFDRGPMPASKTTRMANPPQYRSDFDVFAEFIFIFAPKPPVVDARPVQDNIEPVLLGSCDRDFVNRSDSSRLHRKVEKVFTAWTEGLYGKESPHLLSFEVRSFRTLLGFALF